MIEINSKRINTPPSDICRVSLLPTPPIAALVETQWQGSQSGHLGHTSQNLLEVTPFLSKMHIAAKILPNLGHFKLEKNHQPQLSRCLRIPVAVILLTTTFSKEHIPPICYCIPNGTNMHFAEKCFAMCFNANQQRILPILSMTSTVSRSATGQIAPV